MKRRNGFTIVELVIVIAVIAILSAVLIPTFSGMISKANITADVQDATGVTAQLRVYDGDLSSVEAVLTAVKDMMGGKISPRSVGKGYHFWYDIMTETVLLAKVEEGAGGVCQLRTHDDKVLSPVSPTQAADVTGVAFYVQDSAKVGKVFFHGDNAPRCLIGGYVLLDTEGSSLATFLSAVDAISLETITQYVEALNDLPTASRKDDYLYSQLLRDNGSTFLTDDGIIVIGEVANPHHVGGSVYPQNRDVHAFTADGTEIAAPDWQDLMGGITDLYLSTQGVLVTEESLFFPSTTEVEVHVSCKASELSDIFTIRSISTNVTIVLSNGERYQLWLSESQQGTDSDDRAVIVKVDEHGASLGVAGVADVTPYLFDLAYSAPTGKSEYLPQNETLYVAGEAGSIDFTIRDVNPLVQCSDTTIHWASSNEGVAAFGEALEGGIRLNLVGKGTTTITATANAGGHAVSYKIAVVAPDALFVKYAGNALATDTANTFGYDGSSESFTLDSAMTYNFTEMGLTLCDSTITYSTEGELFTISDTGVITLIAGKTYGTQEVTVKVGPTDKPYLTHTFPIKVVDVSRSPYQKRLNDPEVLYRIGNQNPVALSSLFTYLPGTDAKVTLAIVDATRTGGGVVPPISADDATDRLCIPGGYTTTYTTPEDFANATIKFKGTGVAILYLTVESVDTGDRWDIRLALEVVNATNLTTDADGYIEQLTMSVGSKRDLKDDDDAVIGKIHFGTYSLSGKDYVLLDDVKFHYTNAGTAEGADLDIYEEKLSITKSTLYGNGFTLDFKGLKYTNAGVSLSTNARLDHARVVGSMFDVIEIDGEQIYNFSLVILGGEGATLSNCFVSETRTPVRVQAKGCTVYIENCLLWGGSQCNLDHRTGHLVLKDSVTYNQSRPLLDDEGNSLGSNVSGLGIIMMHDPRYPTPSMEIRGTIKQYNWLQEGKEADLPAGGYYISEFGFEYRDAYKKLFSESNFANIRFTYNGTKWANAGILYVDPVSNSTIKAAADKLIGTCTPGGFALDTNTLPSTYGACSGKFTIAVLFDMDFRVTTYHVDKFSDTNQIGSDLAYTAEDFRLAPFDQMKVDFVTLSQGVLTDSTYQLGSLSAGIRIGINGGSATLDVKELISASKYTGQTFSEMVYLNNVASPNGILTFSEEGTYVVKVVLTNRAVFNPDGSLGTPVTYSYECVVTVTDTSKPALSSTMSNSDLKWGTKEEGILIWKTTKYYWLVPALTDLKIVENGAEVDVATAYADGRLTVSVTVNGTALSNKDSGGVTYWYGSKMDNKTNGEVVITYTYTNNGNTVTYTKTLQFSDSDTSIGTTSWS